MRPIGLKFLHRRVQNGAPFNVREFWILEIAHGTILYRQHLIGVKPFETGGRKIPAGHDARRKDQLFAKCDIDYFLNRLGVCTTTIQVNSDAGRINAIAFALSLTNSLCVLALISKAHCNFLRTG